VFGYASVLERNWFALRRFEIPVLPAGAEPFRVLHLSDAHTLTLAGVGLSQLGTGIFA